MVVGMMLVCHARKAVDDDSALRIGFGRCVYTRRGARRVQRRPMWFKLIEWRRAIEKINWAATSLLLNWRFARDCW
jgi:hypothetical protein